MKTALTHQPIQSISPTQKRSTPLLKATFGSDTFVKETSATHPIHPSMRPFESELTKKVYNGKEKPSGLELQQWCKKTDETHLGVPTLDFINGTPTQRQVNQVFKDMDTLVSTIKESRKEIREEGLQTQINGLPVHIKDTKKYGNYGHIYKITIQDKAYALKVYHSPYVPNSKRGLQGTYPEISNGIFFTNKPTKDLSYMYFGNPESGYALYEWLDETTDINARPGKTLWDLGYYNSDDGLYRPHKETQIGGVTFDHGAIEKLDQHSRESRQFHILPSHPNIKFRYENVDNLHKEHKLPDSWLLAAYQHLFTNCPTMHRLMSGDSICYLPKHLKSPIFKIAVDASPVSRLEAIENSFKIFSKEKITKELEPLFKQYPEHRKDINDALDIYDIPPFESKKHS